MGSATGFASAHDRHRGTGVNTCAPVGSSPTNGTGTDCRWLTPADGTDATGKSKAKTKAAAQACSTPLRDSAPGQYQYQYQYQYHDRDIRARQTDPRACTVHPDGRRSHER